MSVREAAWRFCRALAAAVFLAFAGHARPVGPLVFGSSNRTNDVPTQRSRMTSKHAVSRTTAATPGFTWLWAASITMVFTILSVIAPAVATGAAGGPSGTATTHRATATTASHLPPLGQAPSPAVGVAGAASIAPGALGIAATGFAAEGVTAISSVDDVFADPQVLKDRTPAQVEAQIGNSPGWRVETLSQGSHAGQGWILREYTPEGNPTGRMIQWHPGGGHHGPSPYWKVSSGTGGTVRIFQ